MTTARHPLKLLARQMCWLLRAQRRQRRSCGSKRLRIWREARLPGQSRRRAPLSVGLSTRYSTCSPPVPVEVVRVSRASQLLNHAMFSKTPRWALVPTKTSAVFARSSLRSDRELHRRDGANTAIHEQPTEVIAPLRSASQRGLSTWKPSYVSLPLRLCRLDGFDSGSDHHLLWYLGRPNV